MRVIVAVLLFLFAACGANHLGASELEKDRKTLRTVAGCAGILAGMVELSRRMPEPDWSASEIDDAVREFTQSSGRLSEFAFLHGRAAGLSSEEILNDVAAGVLLLKPLFKLDPQGAHEEAGWLWVPCLILPYVLDDAESEGSRAAVEAAVLTIYPLLPR